MTTPIISGHTGAPYDRRGRFGIEEAEVKLTIAQEKAMAELTHEWQSASQLHARLSTLDALVARELAERLIHAHSGPHSPRDDTYFRLKGDNE